MLDLIYNALHNNHMNEIIANEFLIRAFVYIDTRAEYYACNAIEALMENPTTFNRFQFINRMADEIVEKLWAIEEDIDAATLAKVEDYLDQKIEAKWGDAMKQFVEISSGREEMRFGNWTLLHSEKI